MSSAEFSVASSASLSIQDLYAVPNPVSRTTSFTFRHNQLSAIDVSVKVYTVGGRLVQVLERRGIADRFIRLPWDCRDADGDNLGNGTYFFRVIAKTVDGRYSSEATGRISIVR
jgi:flagellar hook assembly protein FlgD